MQQKSYKEHIMEKWGCVNMDSIFSEVIETLVTYFFVKITVGLCRIFLIP